MNSASFLIDGMVCTACTAKLENQITKLQGVSSANVSLAEDMLVCILDNGVTEEDIINEVGKTGYTAYKNTEENAKMLEERMLKRMFRYAFTAFLFTVLLTRSSELTLTILFASIVQFGVGSLLYKEAVNGLRCKTINMSFMVMLSSSCAYLYSVIMLAADNLNQLYFDSGCMVITMVLAGKLIERKAYSNSGSALEKLMEQAPKTNTKIDDVISIDTGERIPADGVVIEGCGKVDESLLTGESSLVEKAVGSQVFAATMMAEGTFALKVTKDAAETVYANIIASVRHAMSSKSHLQNIAEKVVGVFCPIVVLIALTAGLIWAAFISPGDLSKALLTAMSTLVIACPCALGIATPLAMSQGIGNAAKRGVILKNGQTIETLSKIQTICFDKTGTITRGDFANGKDALKPKAKRSIEKIKDLGITVVMITGDKPDAAADVAEAAGIHRYYAEVLPDEKAGIIDEIKSDKTVSMVGDGFNDAPALLSSDVGMAIGGRADIAQAAADVILMDGDIDKIAGIIEISRETLKVVKQNLIFASIYNAVGIGFSVCGMLDPVIASVAMSLSSISVTLNSARLGRNVS